MIIDAIREFIKQCPHIEKFNVNVNFLSDEINSYSLEEVPVNPILEKYVGGDTVRQFDFVFSSREAYGIDVFQNLQNSGFYEDFLNWIEKQDYKGNLPNLGLGREAQHIKVISTPYAFETEADKARYQIQLKLVYFQKGGI